MVFQANGLILLPEDVDDFLLLGNAGDGLIDDFQFLQRRRGRVELAEASVNQNEAGERLFFFQEPAISALDDFLHACKVIVAPGPANDELAIVGFLHPAVFPNYHGSNCVGALQVGDIEALDASRRLR